jgi:hypothetical protein
MRTHVNRTVAACFAVLRHIRSVRRSLPTSAVQTLVVSLAFSKLDYGNPVLINLPAYLLRRLQSMMNAAARTIVGLSRSAYVSAILADLYWLKMPERIRCKLAVITHHCFHGTAPHYLTSQLCRNADIPARRRLLSTTGDSLDGQPLRL